MRLRDIVDVTDQIVGLIWLSLLIYSLVNRLVG